MSEARTPAPEDEAGNPRRGPIRRWLSHLIIVAGVAWVVLIFWREFPALRGFLVDVDWAWLVYTLIAGCVAQLVLVPVFRLLLLHLGSVSITYADAARLLFVAQLLRHLPGRFWGVLYLVRETRDSMPSAVMIRANLDLMIYSLVFSLLISGMLVSAVLLGAGAATALVVLALAAISVAIRFDWTGALLRRIVRLFPARAARLEKSLEMSKTMTWYSTSLIVVSYVFAWLLYLSVWWVLPLVFPGLAGVNVWLLCAAYSAAWVVGYVAMITPGGLGIREAGFIAMSAKLASVASLTFLAVFVRLWQILIEFSLFLVFAIVNRNRRTVS